MVTVIGLGFVGLTTALGLAELGNKVYGIEADENKAGLLQHGKVPFMEPMLTEMLNKHSHTDFILNSTLEEAIADSEAVFFCVGTPYGENGEANLDYLFSAIDQVLDAISDDKFRCLVIKSSVPPSTTKEIIIPYICSKGKKVSEEIGVAVNPEFLREGHCWEDFVGADRVVIGVEDDKSEKILRGIYAEFSSVINCVSYNTSEFIKYLSNSSLACLISFSNEMSLAADTIGDIDIGAAFKIVHSDKRWQTGSIRSYLYPGCGYGGYCLPKDTNALYYDTLNKGYDCGILKKVIETNDSMAVKTAERIIRAVQDNVITDKAGMESTDGKMIGILGLSFNPGSDDVRDTPAAKIIKELNNRGYNKITAYDPFAIDKFREAYPDLCCSFETDYDSVKSKSDVLVVVTSWDIFTDLRQSDKKVVDCRYFL